MALVCFGDIEVELAGSQTVLDALLEAGIEVPYSCKSGCCHSCLLRATRGVPPAAAQRGLKPTLAEQGYFLSCIATPEGDLEVTMPQGDQLSVPGTIAEVTRVSHNVARVLIEPHRQFDYKAGQFLSLVRHDGLVRSYSIASLPQRDRLVELHIRHIPGGRMSSWLFEDNAVASEVELRGPAGECFYLSDKDEPLLLVGTGTGLAPLWGIVQDALAQGHRGQISLYHGAVDKSGLYLVEPLQKLAKEQPSFSYYPCLLQGEPAEGYQIGPIDQLVLDSEKNLAEQRVYLCGDPALVNSLRKKLFLAGASNKRIHADAFVMANS